MSKPIFAVGQRTNIAWDIPFACAYVGTVVAVDRRGVVVEFDADPAAGLKRRQRFTKRKNGQLVAAGWHWVIGIPVLIPEVSR